MRKRARVDGPAAVLEPRTRRPRSSPSKLTDEVKSRPCRCGRRLEASGLDHGPISVHDKMHAMGLAPVPSVASLARIFREAGVARLEPRKRPRAAWRRFVYPAPNACWQLDATEYVLTGGRKCVIFQLMDDHSRLAVASHVAPARPPRPRSRWCDKAIADHGVPQRLLSDNGLALNPSRRGCDGQLVAHVCRTRRRGDHRQALQADHPGQERTLPPDPVPLPRQATAGRHTGRTAGPGRRVRPHLQHRTPPPRAPRARHTPDRVAGNPEGRGTPPQTGPAHLPGRPAAQRRPDRQPPADLPAGTRVRTVTSVGDHHAGQGSTTWSADSTASSTSSVTRTDGDKITVADLEGEILIEHTRPTPGIKYVGNGRPRGTAQDPETVTEVLTHQLSPMS